MWLTTLSVRRPLTITMVILGMIVLGWRAYGLLKVDRFPKVDFPIVTVVTTFPGASPEDVESLIVKPVEDAVAGIAGIDQLTARAVEGAGTVIIQFKQGVNGAQAATDVERQIGTIRNRLPTDADDPLVIKADFNAIPVLQLVLRGPQTQDELYRIANDDLKARIQSVQGVASVGISGGRKQEVQINVDPDRLAAYGLSLAAVQQVLQANNLNSPAGSIETGRSKTSIRSLGEFNNIEDIRDIVIAGKLQDGDKSVKGKDDTGLVRLRDVADIELGYKDKETHLRYNAADAVSLSVVKTSDANTVEMADQVKEMVAELNKDLPSGAKLSVVIDGAQFIRDSLASVQEDLMLAIVITGIVMLVFLHTIRSTFIVILAVPTCIISTFLVMWVVDFSLNQLTLLALTLVIGILVDDSIVVIENIERHLKMHKPSDIAAIEGRSEIGFAAMTITLVDVVVYVPVAFVSGIIGQFFFSYGITIAVSTLLSLFVAFTLTPMMAALLMKDESRPEAPARGLRKVFGLIGHYTIGWAWNIFIRVWEAGYDQLVNLYGLTLRFFLANIFTQGLAVAIAIGALLAGVWMVATGLVGSEFIPKTDENKFTVNFQYPPGTNLAATDKLSHQIEQIILKNVPEATVILTNVGAGGGNVFGGGTSQPNSGKIDVLVVDKLTRPRKIQQIADELRPHLQGIPEATISLETSDGGGGAGQSPIQVRISGPDQSELIGLSDQVEAAISTVPGVTEVVNNDAVRSRETQLTINRAKAKDLGISSADIGRTLRTSLSGSKIGNFNLPNGTEIDLTLRVTPEARTNLNQLLKLPLRYQKGTPILLDQVVETSTDLAPARITRSDRQRTLTVGSGIVGRAIGDVANDVEAAVNKSVTFPAGYTFALVGQAEQQREAFADLLSALGLSILLTYMLLVALYQSWLQPLAIMFSLPVTLVGAFGGLWLTHNTLNIISILGIILLAGVVTKNAILLVDFTNSLRDEQGYSTKEALIEAGKLRLRPIIMTTMALCFALLPLLFGVAAGAELRAPLAAVVIGGSISSTLLTLILVPVVYNFFDWTSGMTSRVFEAVWGSESEVEEVENMPEPEEDPKPEPRHRQPQAMPQTGPAIGLQPQIGLE